jgi:hypothetical protein
MRAIVDPGRAVTRSSRVTSQQFGKAGSRGVHKQRGENRGPQAPGPLRRRCRPAHIAEGTSGIAVGRSAGAFAVTGEAQLTDQLFGS